MHITANLFVETILHTPLISCLGTFEPKRHRHIAEGSKGSNERRLLLVLNCHFYLMIARIGIQKTQTLATHRSINDLINTGEGKGVCRASFIQIRIVHTHAPSAVLLENQHRISKPLGIENFHDEASCQKPGHLFSNGFSSLFIEPTEVLFHRFILRIHIKCVLNESPRYTWHV